ncbi:tRNA-specific 2-thiouridylase MnmA [Trichinella pseudospiralis]
MLLLLYVSAFTKVKKSRLLVLKLVAVSSLCTECVSLFDNAVQVYLLARRGRLSGMLHVQTMGAFAIVNCKTKHKVCIFFPLELSDYDNEADEQFYHYR